MKLSIRGSLILWYSGILAIILCVFGWVLYNRVDINLKRDLDSLLSSQAEVISETVEVYLKEQGQAGFYRWAKETSELKSVRSVRLIDINQKLLVQSQHFPNEILPINSTLLNEARHGQMVFETLNTPQHLWRLLTYPVMGGTHVRYWIQIASSLQQTERSLNQLKYWLLFLIPATVLFSSLVGSLLASITLKPVQRMTNQAQQIEALHLHERIPVPHTGDELEKLAVTLNELLARLDQSFRRLRQFSAAASHELRTPLTILKGELELALRKVRSPQEYQETLTALKSAIDEMTAIVEQLLMLSHQLGGEKNLEWREIGFHQLLAECLPHWQELAANKKIQFVSPYLTPIFVWGEKRLLERLVQNLLDNAVKYTAASGKVEVSLQSIDSQLVLNVRDTGVGISAEQMPHVFDKFFSKNLSVQDPQVPSTGLGLGLCRWIVELHGGKIEINSEKHKGTTVTVTLPLQTLPK